MLRRRACCIHTPTVRRPALVIVMARVVEVRGNALFRISGRDDNELVVGKDEVVQILQRQSLVRPLHYWEAIERSSVADAQVKYPHVGGGTRDAVKRRHHELVVNPVGGTGQCRVLADHGVVETALARRFRKLLTIGMFTKHNARRDKGPVIADLPPRSVLRRKLASAKGL